MGAAVAFLQPLGTPVKFSLHYISDASLKKDILVLNLVLYNYKFRKEVLCRLALGQRKGRGGTQWIILSPAEAVVLTAMVLSASGEAQPDL